MKLAPARFGFACGGLVLVAAAVVMFLHLETAQLRLEAAHTNAQLRLAQDLSQERAALAQQAPAATQVEALRHELASLPTERAALEDLRADVQRATLAAMQRPAVAVEAARPLPDQLTPEATIQAVIRAVRDGEVAELATLLEFDDAANDEAGMFFASLPEDLRAGLGSPRLLVAQVMTAKTGMDYASTTVDPPAFSGPEDASVRLRMLRRDGASRQATLHLHRSPQGWSLRVPAKVIEGYRALVTGDVTPVSAGN